ncbi:tyrosine protein kinase [Enterococcus florum]|uniref:Tyrosine-protein kinase CpsD n=1 Tax=Enterococcus florum TaxID=2480627 RepID=A0A4V0WPB6_9ENTE|nr:CpsD/CapB family tyrosine-protein kinase [Enterococcus florum]GCF93289.1 tyrosine protein kinase [Enterococcus florum]
MVKKKRRKTTPVALVAATSEDFSIAAEQYRSIRSNINFASVDKDIRTLVITSSGPAEGKSTTAANLAIVFANAGSRVLLVDADMRKPSVALSFKLKNNRGLSDLLTSREASVDDYCQKTMIQNLFVLTSGSKPPNPSELLGSKRMAELMKTMQKKFDLVVFDMPPLAAVTDAQIMAARTDGTILVVREGKTRKQEVLQTKEMLVHARANILGVVYNGKKKRESGSYYYYN